MNVKMDGKSLRFKITGDELEELLQGRVVVNQLYVGDAVLTVLIDPKPAVPDGMCVQYLAEKDAAVLRLMAGADRLSELKAMGKSRDGICVSSGETVVHLLVDARKTSAG